MNSKYNGSEVEQLLDKIRTLSKEDLEHLLTGNVTTHAHDTEIVEPECDILSVATLEEDMQNLVGDGTTFPLSGEGTEANPFIIDSALKWVLFHLQLVLSMSSIETKGYFRLTVNCDLGGLEIPISLSTGTPKIQYSLDGGSHFIRNFTLSGENTIVAPFPILGQHLSDSSSSLTVPYEIVDAEVRNIGFKDAIYKLECDGRLGSTDASIAGIGGILINTTGSAPARSAIQNCYVDNVQLTVTNSYRYAGSKCQILISPFCGANLMSNIKDCYAKEIKVNVDNVDSAPIGYLPFGSVIWTSDYYYFENLYSEATLKSNQGLTQETFSTDEKVIFNNCFYNSNYTSSSIPIGVEAVSLVSLKTLAMATQLGEQFAWDRAKNDSYPYLVGQPVREVMFDGYVRGDELKAELEKIGSAGGNGTSSGVVEFPFELFELSASASSDEILAAAGGIEKFYQLAKAAQNSKNCVCYMKQEIPDEGIMSMTISLDAMVGLINEDSFILMLTCFPSDTAPNSVKEMTMFTVMGGVASLEKKVTQVSKTMVVDGSFINDIINKPYSKQFSSSEILGWFGGLEKFCQLIRSFSDADSVVFKWRGKWGNRILSTFDYYWYNESLATLTLPVEPDYEDLAGIHQRYVITISCGSNGTTLDLWRDSVEIPSDVLKLTNTSASDTIINAWGGLAELQAKWEAIKLANHVYSYTGFGSSSSTETVNKRGYCNYSHYEVVETTNESTGEIETKLCLARSYVDTSTLSLKTQRLVFIHKNGHLTAAIS